MAHVCRRKQPTPPGSPSLRHAPLFSLFQVAINGCGHGDLDLIYEAIQAAEQRGGFKVDLLLSCGDFQAMRSVDDLHCFACPPKYRAMKDFHRYYTGKSKAYVPTIFGALLLHIRVLRQSSLFS